MTPERPPRFHVFDEVVPVGELERPERLAVTSVRLDGSLLGSTEYLVVEDVDDLL